MGAPAPHLRVLDEHAALTTGLSLTVIDIEVFLMGTLAPCAVAVIPEGGAAVPDASLNHLIDSCPEASALLMVQAA